MDNLIKALQIFQRYDNSAKIVSIWQGLKVHINPEVVSAEDKATLEGLGFEGDMIFDTFMLNLPEGE